MKKIKSLIKRYGITISNIEKSDAKTLTKLNKCIALSQECLNQLRVHIREHDFVSQEEEIDFFKHKKPKIYGKLKFFAHQLNFLSECPDSSIGIQKIFINKALKKLESEKKKNLTFYKYYNHNETSFDDKYFVRGNNQLDLFSNTFHLNKDPQFSTSHDLVVAEIIAYDLIIDYYKRKLESFKLNNSQIVVKEVLPKILSNLPWTASKTDLVELLYALNASGAIKNGEAEMKKLVEICKQLFGIDLGNIYKTYSEIKVRENDPTKFLDLMKINLIRKLNSEQ
ncbi:RteC protein [Lutibacter oceani]|uniref:RteC protein n=1 Tax=Lutibacter oceani TaxID=1853311 RepID=A0A3D9RSV5_9FLAO|nr:RteC domain-containing protein [Lutibacter oceani]REE83020.1 RteC protein [Lutibacter oceani]